jgi:UDP:flavonoid glycosyltransferase YjiC (YdhE family)
MRVLFAGAPAAGHLFPLVPLATALTAHGHEVAVASLDGGEVIAGAGLPFANVAPGVDWRRELRRLGAAHRPDLMQRTVDSNSADREAFVPLAALVNSLVADAMVRAAAEWKPDLVVYEYLYPVGLLAAARLGVPAVQHDLGFARTPRLRALMLAEMAPTFDRLGVAVPERVPTIDIAPPSMIGGDVYGWPMRPVAYSGPGTLPDELAGRPDRPRIAVTLGTVAPKTDGLTRLHRVVTAAGAVDAEFVLVTGNMDLTELGELPPNVRPVGWVPWHEVLRTCAASVHHGGSGTALATLAAGLPQLVLPDGSDRIVNAQAVHARGAGLTATAADVDADLLRRVLTDDGLRRAAREVRAEIAAMPAPADLIPRLTDLVDGHDGA